MVNLKDLFMLEVIFVVSLAIIIIGAVLPSDFVFKTFFIGAIIATIGLIIVISVRLFLSLIYKKKIQR